MDNSETMASYGTQGEEKHNTICVRRHYTQTSTNNLNKTCALLLLDVKTNRTSFICIVN